MARKKPDPKEEALRAARALNPRPEAVAPPSSAPREFFDARDLVQVRYEMVRRVRVEGEPVSAAAAEFGFSRPSWYAAAAAIDEGGLPWAVAGPARAPAGRTSSRLRSWVFDRALEADPGLRAADWQDESRSRFGISVSPSFGGEGPGAGPEAQKLMTDQQHRRRNRGPGRPLRGDARRRCARGCGPGRAGRRPVGLKGMAAWVHGWRACTPIRRPAQATGRAAPDRLRPGQRARRHGPGLQLRRANDRRPRR